MLEIRCKKCHKLLGYIDGKYEIKCPRCSWLNYDPGEDVVSQCLRDKIEKSGSMKEKMKRVYGAIHNTNK